jgi:hypothetical protein
VRESCERAGARTAGLSDGWSSLAADPSRRSAPNGTTGASFEDGSPGYLQWHDRIPGAGRRERGAACGVDSGSRAAGLRRHVADIGRRRPRLVAAPPWTAAEYRQPRPAARPRLSCGGSAIAGTSGRRGEQGGGVSGDCSCEALSPDGSTGRRCPRWRLPRRSAAGMASSAAWTAQPASLTSAKNATPTRRRCSSRPSATNHTVSGVRVSSEDLPATTRTRLR